EQLQAQHRGSELLLAGDDLQQDAARDVGAALVVHHLDPLAARDQLAQVIEGDVAAVLRVVQTPVGVFAYQTLFGHVCGLSAGSAYNMETPFTHAAFKPDAAFAGAAERFLELLRSLGMPGAGAAGAGRDWSSLAAPLAGQFEQWLKTSQSAGPWFAAANAAASGPGAGVGAAQAGF